MFKWTLFHDAKYVRGGLPVSASEARLVYIDLMESKRMIESVPADDYDRTWGGARVESLEEYLDWVENNA